MTLSNFVYALILFHAALGGVALISGFVAAWAPKGQKTHRVAGKTFFYCGTLSIVVSLCVTCFPGHWNPFLLSIGVFSLYFLIIGFRSVHYKNSNYSVFPDKMVTWIMVVCCVLMIGLPIVISQVINIVTTVFGVLGLVLSYGNFKFYQDVEKTRTQWLRFHIIHMSAGFIALVSAFMVVNNFLPALLNWFLPTLVGTFFIVKNLRKYTSVRWKGALNSSLLLGSIMGLSLGVSAQDNPSSIKRRDVTLKIGLSRALVMDKRLSGIEHKSWGPRYSISHTEFTQNSRTHFQVDFANPTGSPSSKIFRLKTVNSNVQLTYQRQMAEGVWVGGFMNTHTLINFPKSALASFFTNNPISYTLTQSIGPAVSFTPGFNSEAPSTGTVQAAALSYVIQPIYGHPYPEKYFKEGVFDPNRTNMTLPLLKSGQLRTVNKLAHFNVQMSLYYVFSNNFKLGMDYNYGYFMANTSGKPVKMKNNDVFVTTGFLY